MDKSILITTLFVDIGGVLLTDGWGHEFRKLAVKEFNLDPEEMETRLRLDEFVDSFISSCYVGLRKPDADIFRLALDIVQVTAEQVVYIENTQMFVQIAEGISIRGIWHTDYKSTREKLASFALEIDP